MKYYKDFDLTNYNSFHLKSIAKEIWFPETNFELAYLLLKLKNPKILSYGTNVLLSPEINCLICLKRMPSEIIWINNKVFCHANVPVQKLISSSLNNGCGGFEGLLGLPGSVGAAIIGNSGSGNYCISDYLNTVTTINYNADFRIYNKNDLKFSRRYSSLQKKKEIIIEATFIFNKSVNSEEIIKTLNFRKNFPKGYSAGGLFKNWHILKPYEKEIRAIKSPNLHISPMLNVLINKGNATYNEILNFINEIKKIVSKPLKLEIKIL